MAKTRAQQNRELRQTQLREFLAKQKLIEKVLDCAIKIEELPPSEEAPFELQKLKTAADIRIKMINKYLADQKEIASTVDHQIDGVLDLDVSIEVVKALKAKYESE